MSTETLELTELDVNLEEEVPCANPDHDPPKAATHRMVHPAEPFGCSIFVCEECTTNTLAFIREMLRHKEKCSAKHSYSCNHCDREVEIEAVRFLPLE